MESKGLTNQQYEESLKQSVRFYEATYIDYTKMLELMFRDRTNFLSADEFTIWYKDLLREGKNSSKIHMEQAREELTYYRQELNPPFCYPDYWNKH